MIRLFSSSSYYLFWYLPIKLKETKMQIPFHNSSMAYKNHPSPGWSWHIPVNNNTGNARAWYMQRPNMKTSAEVPMGSRTRSGSLVFLGCLHTAIGYNTRPKNHLTKCIFYKDFFYTVCFYVIFCASFSPCSLHPLWQPGKSAASLGFQAASSGGRNIGVVRLAKKSSTWWRGALGDDVTSLEGTSHQEGGPLNEGLERFGSDDFPIFKGGNDFQVP